MAAGRCLVTKQFTELDYSGDVGIEAHATTYAELFEAMTEGLLGLMTHTPPQPVVERAIEVKATTCEELLVDWLSEVIATAATRGEVYGEVRVSRADATRVTGTLHGARVDPRAHDLRFDVKAATYHGLVLEKESDGLRARVIFDL